MRALRAPIWPLPLLQARAVFRCQALWPQERVSEALGRWAGLTGLTLYRTQVQACGVGQMLTHECLLAVRSHAYCNSSIGLSG